MADRLKWGVLGAARIASFRVIPALKASRLCAAAAIASRDVERARAMAGELGVPKAYGGYDELIADPEIDVVYNPLPNHLHLPWTVRALEAGKHVLCEKPIAMNAEEARRIKAAAQANGRLAAEAFMVGFHPQWARVREVIAQGRLGRVQAVQAYFSYPSPPEGDFRNDPAAGGGVLLDIVGYPIVTARMAFGAEPERVVGSIVRDPRHGVDVLTSAIVEFEGGGRLTLTCASTMRRAQKLVIQGEDGVLTVETPFNPSHERPTRLIFDDARDLFGSGVTVEEVPPANQYALMCDAFAEAASEGRPFANSMDEAIGNMRTLDAIARSAETGRWEAV
jgi:predicted dehydrogenase